MSVQILPFQTRAVALTAAGDPLPGAKIYTYESGGTTPLTTYTTDALSTPNANPIIADASGKFGPIWTNGSVEVKIVITTAADATVETIDPVPFGFTAPGWGNFYFNNFGELIRLFQDTTNSPGVSNATLGMSLSAGFGLFVSVNSATAAYFNRAGTDGAVVSIRNDGSQVGSISVSGSATAYNTSSDARLKDNIAPPDDPGPVIDAIAIRQFDFISGGHVRWGIIAQDEIANIPEAITPGEDGEPWGWDASKVVAMLILEVQNLRRRLAALEGER